MLGGCVGVGGCGGGGRGCGGGRDDVEAVDVDGVVCVDAYNDGRYGRCDPAAVVGDVGDAADGEEAACAGGGGGGAVEGEGEDGGDRCVLEPVRWLLVGDIIRLGGRGTGANLHGIHDTRIVLLPIVHASRECRICPRV